MMRNRTIVILLLMLFTVAACAPRPVVQNSGVPTATLAPIVSQTPRLTATPAPTRTPIPTFTPIPPTATTTLTPSNTPTPTEPPPIIGVVNSLQSVNVRTGPGITYSEFVALEPNSDVEVIGQSSDGRWFNILLDNGDEGWIFADLLRLLPTPTPFPTFTPTVDQTAIALGTVFPTAVVGGGAITATLPPDLISPTPVIIVTQDPNAPTPTPRVILSPEPTSTPRVSSLDSTPILLTFTPTPSITPIPSLPVDESVLPVIDIASINATATALAGAPIFPTNPPTRTPAPERGTNLIITPDTGNTSILDRPTANPSAPAPQSDTAIIQEAVDVLAYCDDPSFNAPAPDNLKAGSTIDIFWTWYASEEQYIQQHLDAASYEIEIDGIPLRNIDQYRLPTQAAGNDVVAYWYAPAGPLAAGEHIITYRVTWSEQIFDGYNFYGPGSTYAVEEGSCTFTVYE